MTFDLTTKNWQLPSSYVKTNNSPCGLWELPNNWGVDGGEVVLLISQAGAVGSSTFVDTAKNKVITSTNAVWSNSQTLFGKPTILRTEGFLKITDITSLNLSTSQPFCIEMWYKNMSNLTVINVFFFRSIFDYEGEHLNTSQLSSWIHSNGTHYHGLASIFNGLNHYAPGQYSNWTHFAWTRDANSVIRLFVNGVLTLSGINSAAVTTSDPLLFGCTSQGSNYFAEIRFTKNVPVYTQNFTPPNSGFV